MTDRLLRFVLFTIAICVLPPTVWPESPSPSFAVRIEGRGPAMILIPGFVSSGAAWDDVVAHYRKWYACHVLTLPGFAGQASIPAPILPRVREEIVEYIRRQHLDKPVLVGHSLGGFLALWVAATAPDLMGPIVSVDGVPFLSALANPEATVDSARPQAEQMRALYASLTPAELGRQSRVAFGAMMSDPSRIETATRWAEVSDPRAASVMIAELMTTDLRDRVAVIRTPVLVVAAVKAFGSIAGGQDRARSAYMAQVQTIPSHHVVPAMNALHFVMYDDLPFLLKTMDSFLAPASELER
jgi:N-formylmaleamate deformylase